MITATDHEMNVRSGKSLELPPHPCRFSDIVWVKRNLNIFLFQIENAASVVCKQDRSDLHDYLSIWKHHELECIRDAVECSLKHITED